MLSRASLPSPFVCAAAALLAVSACGGNPKPQQTPTLPPQGAAAAPATAPVQPPPEDPVVVLIAQSQAHFDTGERELKLGHLASARVEFDTAVDLLLQSPYGARTDLRMREHFDRLVDRINAHEVTALAQGDGFSETRTEPASIDEILTIATFPRPDPAASTEAAVRADLASTLHDVPIPQNAKVLEAVELLSGRLRDYVQESLNRGARYLPMIQDVFRAEGLPLDLAYIPIIESGFKTNALSKASAKGPWQFMRPTARDHGLKTDWYIDERSDPEKATVAAARYLKTLHKMFNGDWHLVLAAYNGGLGRLQRAMKTAKDDDFWSLASSSRYLPRETREYVPLILAAIIVGKNPTQYGFEYTPGPPVVYDKVAVPRAVDLRRVAEWTGSSIDDIQALNPELRRWTTPVKYPDYEVKVPAGTAAQFTAQLRQADPSELGALNWHRVRRGETLTSVARKFGVKTLDLAEANHLTTRSRVRPDQELIIPLKPTTLLASRGDRPAPSAVASRALGGPAVVSTSGSDAAPRPAARTATVARATTTARPVTYRVKPGDTLSSIARLFDTTIDHIKSLNRLRTSRIAVGDRLTIKPR
jgi:membrane-bound lytic murein transglycosylase D